MEQVTALELRKNLAEISRQVREDDLKPKVLMVHGEPNMGLVSPDWAEVVGKVGEISKQQVTMVEMNQDLAKILYAQAEALKASKEPVPVRDVINTLVEHAMIFSKAKALDKAYAKKA